MDRKFNWLVKPQNDNDLVIRYCNIDEYEIGFVYKPNEFTFTIYINDIFIETTEQSSLDAIEKYCEDNSAEFVGMYNDIIWSHFLINMTTKIK